MKVIGITGIDTNVGKTVVSAIITEALEADYWKLVQAGDLDDLDSDTVRRLISNKKTVIHPERHLLTEPMSPHAAANIDQVKISPEDFTLPETDQTLIVEGAGGILVPINENKDTIGDLFTQLVDEVIIVSKHYLGSINHTLLTIHYLNSINLPIKGAVFVGDENYETERIIKRNTGIKIIGRIPMTQTLNQAFVSEQATKIRANLV